MSTPLLQVKNLCTSFDVDAGEVRAVNGISFSLDKGKVLGIRKLGEGNVNTVSITTRLVAEAALSLNAAAVVLAHNHVSGIAFPSEDDVATTDSLAPLLARLGVELVDHLIFVDDDMVSLRDSGFYRP